MIQCIAKLNNNTSKTNLITVVLTVVRVMIAKYRKSGIWGYRSSLTPETIELILCMSVTSPVGPHTHNRVTKGLGG